MAKKKTQKIKSRPSLFGTTIHYDEKGRKIGESRPGFFGATIHTNAKGKTVGKSYDGFFGSTDHYDVKGHNVGRTDPVCLVHLRSVRSAAFLNVDDIFNGNAPGV